MSTFAPLEKFLQTPMVLFSGGVAVAHTVVTQLFLNSLLFTTELFTVKWNTSEHYSVQLQCLIFILECSM